jgi:hypothetical protein
MSTPITSVSSIEDRGILVVSTTVDSRGATVVVRMPAAYRAPRTSAERTALGQLLERPFIERLDVNHRHAVDVIGHHRRRVERNDPHRQHGRLDHRGRHGSTSSRTSVS